MKRRNSCVAVLLAIIATVDRVMAVQSGPVPLSPTVQAAIDQMKLDEPNELAPVSIGAVAIGSVHERDGTYTASKGERVTLVVRLKIAPGWHTYAHAPDHSPLVPTAIKFDLPAGARWNGEFHVPTAYPDPEPGVTEYVGDAIFTRKLYFMSVPTQGRDRQGRVELTLMGTVRYQVCNAELCMPPKTERIETNLTLVAASELAAKGTQ